MVDCVNIFCNIVVASAWSPQQGPLGGGVQCHHEGGTLTQTFGDHEGSLLDIEQMFDTDSVFGAKISQTIIETPPEHCFVWAHWRQNHAFVAVSTSFILDILC